MKSDIKNVIVYVSVCQDFYFNGRPACKCLHADRVFFFFVFSYLVDDLALFFYCKQLTLFAQFVTFVLLRFFKVKLHTLMMKHHTLA